MARWSLLTVTNLVNIVQIRAFARDSVAQESVPAASLLLSQSYVE